MGGWEVGMRRSLILHFAPNLTPRHSRERGNPVTWGLGVARRTECSDVSGFAPSGESLLSNATKGTKKACPNIRARWSRATLTNSPATEARPEGTSL